MQLYHHSPPGLPHAGLSTPRDRSMWSARNYRAPVQNSTGPLGSLSVVSSAIISTTIRLRLTTCPIIVLKYQRQPCLTPALLSVTILPNRRCVMLPMEVIYEQGDVMYSDCTQRTSLVPWRCEEVCHRLLTSYRSHEEYRVEVEVC